MCAVTSSRTRESSRTKSAESLVKAIVDAGERLKASSIEILKRSKRETHLIESLLKEEIAKSADS